MSADARRHSDVRDDDHAITTTITLVDGTVLPDCRRDLLNIADLQARGWSVIPLKPRSKIPAVRWQEYQHRHATIHELEDWFSEPGFNVGIVTGALSGIYVIDADSPDAIDWVERNLPKCDLRVRTAKGLHLYIPYRRSPADPEQGTDKRRRQDARYRYPGGGRFRRGSGLSASRWSPLRSRRRRLAVVMNHTEAEAIGTVLGIYDDAAPAQPASLKEGLIPTGQRNHVLTSHAGAMRRRGLTPQAIEAALIAQNSQCDPPLDEREVRAIASSIGRYQPASGTSSRYVHGLRTEGLADATVVAAEGRAIEASGVPYVVDGIIPNFGMLGMLVGYAKVGKTSFEHALGRNVGAAVAAGASWLDREVRQARVLIIAAEDPAEYTAWLARHFDVPPGVVTFYRLPIQLDDDGLDAICTTVRDSRSGLVLIASWQAVVTTLVKDENDNAGAVAVVERVKAATRATGVPWLIDAHSGKGEDQSDEADPTKAMRGASGAAGAADFLLSLRYAEGPFSTRRRLSGKGRFVSFQPMLLDYDVSSGTFTVLADGMSAKTESTWARIVESGVLRDWCSVVAIAMAISMGVDKHNRITGAARRTVQQVLRGRDGIDTKTETRRGQKTTLYRLGEGQT